MDTTDRERAMQRTIDLLTADRQRAVRRAEDAEAMVCTLSRQVRELRRALGSHAARMALTEAGAAA